MGAGHFTSNVRRQLSDCSRMRWHQLVLRLEPLLCTCVALPAGPVAHLVRGLCGRVLNNMMGDLRAEVARRQQLEAAAQAAHTTGKGGLDWVGICMQCIMHAMHWVVVLCWLLGEG